MLSTHIAFELDKNAIFLRNQELNLHHGKLFSIQTRKNKYINTEPKVNRLSRNNKYTELQYSISKDNSYLGEKLQKISLRSNKSLICNTQYNSFIKKKNIASLAINDLNVKLQNEFVKSYRKRIVNVPSVVDNKKINKDFQVTRSVYKHLRKIQPHQSAVNVFKSYSNYIATRSQHEGKSVRSRLKKELPPIQSYNNIIKKDK